MYLNSHLTALYTQFGEFYMRFHFILNKNTLFICFCAIRICPFIWPIDAMRNIVRPVEMLIIKSSNMNPFFMCYLFVLWHKYVLTKSTDTPHISANHVNIRLPSYWVSSWPKFGISYMLACCCYTTSTQLSLFYYYFIYFSLSLSLSLVRHFFCSYSQFVVYLFCTEISLYV